MAMRGGFEKPIPLTFDQMRQRRKSTDFKEWDKEPGDHIPYQNTQHMVPERKISDLAYVTRPEEP